MKRYVILFALSSLVFNNWLLGLILNFRLIKAGGSVSELSASTQPHHLLFQSADALAGSLILLTALVLWRLSTGRLQRARIILLAVCGVMNISDALMALPCSGTLSSSCLIPVRLSPAHFYLPPHTYSSAALGFLFLALPVLSVALAIRQRRRGFLVVSSLTILVTLAFFMLLLTASTSGYFQASRSAGLAQYLQMAAFGVWMFYFGLASVFRLSNDKPPNSFTNNKKPASDRGIKTASHVNTAEP